MPGASDPVVAHRRTPCGPAMPDMLASAIAIASDTMYIAGGDQTEGKTVGQESHARTLPERGTLMTVESQSTNIANVSQEDSADSKGVSDLSHQATIAPTSTVTAVTDQEERPEPITAEPLQPSARTSSAQRKEEARTHLHGRESSADDDLNRLVLEKFTCYETRTVSALKRVCAVNAN